MRTCLVVRHLVSATLVSAIGPACLLALASVPAAAQTGRVAGTVRDADGRPIRGATVTAENASSAPASFTAVSDEKGKFALIGLQSGAWTFAATAPGYAQARGRADVSARRSNPPIDFRLQRSVSAGELLPLAGVNSKELQDALRAADELLAAGKYDEAIAAYEATRARVPSLTLINLAIGHAYRMKKDDEKALAAYRAVLESDTDNGTARAAIASICLERGDPKSAEDALGPAAGKPSAGRDVLYGMGEVKRAQGLLDEAAAWYQKAATLDPAWVRPIFGLGQVASARNDTESAVKLMQKVITLDPGSSEAAQARAFLDQIKK